jgi:transcriptional regulator with XRE-family HTH domain
MSQYGWNSKGAQEIRDALESAKVSQRELARRMGVSERTARRWCEGVQQPRSMAAIKKALGLMTLALAVLLSGCGRERIEIDGQQYAVRNVSPQQVARWEADAKRRAQFQMGMMP